MSKGTVKESEAQYFHPKTVAAIAAQLIAGELASSESEHLRYLNPSLERSQFRCNGDIRTKLAITDAIQLLETARDLTQHLS